MNVGHDRNLKRVVHLFQYFQSLDIADTRKGVNTRTVGLTVTALKHVRDIQTLCYFGNVSGNFHCHTFTLDDTRTGKQKEIVVF